MPALHIAILIAFAALLLTAAYTDLRRFQIPNAIPVALLALYPAFVATAANPPHLVASVTAAAVVFSIGALLFGGDVKLFAAATLWVGLAGLEDFVVGTALIGGVLAGVLLTRRGAALASRIQLVDPDPGATGMRRPMPYGIAISTAALATVLWPFQP